MWEIIVNIVTYIIDWWVGDTQDIPFIDPISIKENNINNQNKGYLGYQDNEHGKNVKVVVNLDEKSEINDFIKGNLNKKKNDNILTIDEYKQLKNFIEQLREEKVPKKDRRYMVLGSLRCLDLTNKECYIVMKKIYPSINLKSFKEMVLTIIKWEKEAEERNQDLYQYEYEYDPKTKNKIEEIGKMEVLKEISKKVI